MINPDGIYYYVLTIISITSENFNFIYISPRCVYRDYKLPKSPFPCNLCTDSFRSVCQSFSQKRTIITSYVNPYTIACSHQQCMNNCTERKIIDGCYCAMPVANVNQASGAIGSVLTLKP